MFSFWVWVDQFTIELYVVFCVIIIFKFLVFLRVCQKELSLFLPEILLCFKFHFFFNEMFTAFFRIDYLEKSRYLQDQLRDLRSEIEVLKVGEKSEFDLIHDEQVRAGENKYSTLKRVNPTVLTCLLRTRAFTIEDFSSYVCFVYKIMQLKMTFLYPVGVSLYSKLELYEFNTLFLLSVSRK